MRILKIYISQGSVATRLRCGGIFNYSFILYSKFQNSSYDAYLLSCSKLRGLSVKKMSKNALFGIKLKFFEQSVAKKLYKLYMGMFRILFRVK